MSLNLRFLVYMKLRVKDFPALKLLYGIMLYFTDLHLVCTPFSPQGRFVCSSFYLYILQLVKMPF